MSTTSSVAPASTTLPSENRDAPPGAGALAWAKENLFPNWLSTAVTLALGYLIIRVLVALGRRSTQLPAVRMLCVIYVELIRGVPLISVLFMASVMFPLFMPAGVSIDKLLRAQIAVILFAAAYLAEVVRGGLQALPKGQTEAAEALGLSYWHKTAFIILPQALRLVIPRLVNT